MTSIHLYALTSPSNKTNEKRHTFYGIDGKGELYECAITGNNVEENLKMASKVQLNNFYMISNHSLSRNAVSIPFINIHAKQSSHFSMSQMDTFILVSNVIRLFPTFKNNGQSSIQIEISIQKPCTDNCSGLRIEPITTEKHIDLALPIFECIFFCEAYFFADSVFNYLCVLVKKPL